MTMKHPFLTLGIAVLVVLGGVAAWYFLYEGSVAVYVKDATGPWEHVYVNFTAVSIHESGKDNASWTDLNIAKGTVDLASLTSTSELLASAHLAPGHYEQLRIDVSSAYGVTTSGQAVTFTVPSGEARTSGQFTISSAKTTTVTLDLNLSTDIVYAGGSTGIFTPVIGNVTVG